MTVSTDPTTGTELARCTPQSAPEVDAVPDAATSAQAAAWRRRDITEHTPQPREMACVLRVDRDSYAAPSTAEMGKPIAAAGAEIEKCAITSEHYARHAPGQLVDRPLASNADESTAVYDPPAA